MHWMIPERTSLKSRLVFSEIFVYRGSWSEHIHAINWYVFISDFLLYVYWAQPLSSSWKNDSQEIKNNQL